MMMKRCDASQNMVYTDYKARIVWKGLALIEMRISIITIDE